MLLLLLPDLLLMLLLLNLQWGQLHPMPILQARRARSHVATIPIPSDLLLLLLSVVRSLLLLLHHLLLIGQHLRLSLLVLTRADRILHHHAAAVACLHSGFFALAGADGTDEAGGFVFLLLLFAGVGAGIEEGSAGCAGDVHLFAGGEVGGLRVGEEATWWVEVDAGAAGVRPAWWCGLALLDCCSRLVEVHACAAGERTTRGSGLAEMHAGAAGVRSARRGALVWS